MTTEYALRRKGGTKSKCSLSLLFYFDYNLILFYFLFAFTAIKADKDIQWEPAFRMYRGLFLFILELFLFGINLYGWTYVGINHAHICDLKKHLCPIRVLEVKPVYKG